MPCPVPTTWNAIQHNIDLPPWARVCTLPPIITNNAVKDGDGSSSHNPRTVCTAEPRRAVGHPQTTTVLTTLSLSTSHARPAYKLASTALYSPSRLPTASTLPTSPHQNYPSHSERSNPVHLYTRLQPRPRLSPTRPSLSNPPSFTPSAHAPILSASRGNQYSCGHKVPPCPARSCR
ncbi:unnamed protein product [Chondrus crispus]|uniref:Uncharacterized protein n=1 Tax=Chondrus crispus TaxID=2769 RepID=R7QFR0_CHOCR|nr:unnamed protein product [Chondrus crispus]CDF36260.1 unnamed protein product [Chondrus crispus]|eukprot:XP_005716079.1 unnamed protein product [Chondrus crispus]